MVPVATHLQCLCGAVWEPATILKSSSLPITTEICHCNPCRHGSGALCPAFPKLKSSPTEKSLKACTYHSRPGGRIRRYFCSTCGSRTFDHTTDNNGWFACSGIIEPDESVKNVIEVTCHKFIADTIDGGLAPLLPRLGGRDIPMYTEQSDGPRLTYAELSNFLNNNNHASQPREDKLLASCYCTSIQFHILPPHATTNNLNNPEVTKWLRASNTRYLALNCACRYCRRAVGFSFASNTYIMPENIVTITDSAKPIFDYTSHDSQTSDFTTSTKALSTLFPSLKFDFTSPGIRRSFCSGCGASVFFERASRPQCVNVAMGILRARSGALAREWIEFDWEMWSKERAVDRDVVEALEAHRHE